MIDGGSTPLQTCRHLNGLELQVLTNSLHIVSALLGQAGTHVLVSGGPVFQEQNIIFGADGDEPMRASTRPSSSWAPLRMVPMG